MKRFLAICALALGVTAVSDQQASAWSKMNFNIGLNISREAADNSFLWGLFRNGPHPYAQGGGGYAPDQQHPYYNPHAASPQAPAQPMPQASASAYPYYNPYSNYYNQHANYYPTGTQPVSYNTATNNYYQPQGNYWTAPYYWYGYQK